MHGESQTSIEHHGQWLNALLPYIPDWAEAYISPIVLTAWLVIAIVGILAYLGGRRLNLVPTGLQNLWEFAVEALENFSREMIGPGGERFAPFLGAIFIYVFFNSIIGLIPGFVSPTATLNATAAPAIVVFFAVQYFGIREQGLGYVKHYTGDVSVMPLWLAIPMVPIMIVIHLIGELAKPLTLALRLYGNVFGDDTLVAQFIVLAALIMHSIYLPLPLHLPFVFFALLIAFIQAFVFIMLSASYINMALTHGGDDHEPAEPAADAA